MSAPVDSGLAASASRGAVVTVSAQILRLSVQLGGIVVLARLLSPEDYGLVAIVAVLIGFGELFRDFGLFSAAVQAPALSDGQRDNLFWLNAGLGLGLTLLVAAGAPLVALAFGDDRLLLITAALSLTFLVNGVSTQYRAMLARHLRFGRLAAAEIGGQLVGVAVGIVLAAGGAGFWALVAQQLVQGVAVQLILLLTSRWLPGRYRRDQPVRPFLSYALPLLGSHVLNYVAGHVDTIVLGARFGPAPAGIYNRAYQLVTMPLVQIQAPSTRVALPVLARLQDQPRRFGEFLGTGQFVLLTLIGGAFAVLFAQAPAAVALALGPQWSEAVPLLRILLVAGFFRAASYAAYWVFLSQGLTRSQLHYSLATRPLMAVLVVGGSQWGVRGVAVAYAASLALSWPAALLWLRRISDAPVGAMFCNGLRTGLVFGAASAASWLATRALPVDAYGLRMLVGVLAVALAFGLAVLVWPPLRRDLTRVVALRSHLRRGPATAGAPHRRAASQPSGSEPAEVSA